MNPLHLLLRLREWKRKNPVPFDLKSLIAPAKTGHVYSEVTRASKNLFLIFNTSFTKNQEFRNHKFNLVRLLNYFCELDLLRLPIQWFAFYCILWINFLEQELIYGLKNMWYTEVTQASKNFFLIFNTTYKNSGVQKSKFWFGSITELNWNHSMNWVWFSSIGFNWLCRVILWQRNEKMIFF